MESVTLTRIINDTGFVVSEAHFGGNTLYTRNTDNGIPDQNYMTAVEELDIGYLRYPARHPDVAYIDGKRTSDQTCSTSSGRFHGSHRSRARAADLLHSAGKAEI